MLGQNCELKERKLLELWTAKRDFNINLSTDTDAENWQYGRDNIDLKTYFVTFVKE